MASHQLLSEIRTLLRNYQFLQNEDGRRAISVEAGLDEELLSQIVFEGPTAQFLPLLLDQLARYKTLTDGRNALQAFLEAVKDHVGVVEKEKIDRCIAQLSSPDVHDKPFQPLRRNWRRWIFVPVGVLVVAGLVYIIASQIRTTPSSLPITTLKDDSKFEDAINEFQNDGATIRRGDPTLIYSVKPVETTIAASTKKFTWVLSTTRPDVSIAGRAFQVTSRGMSQLELTGGNENTLEFLVDKSDRGDRLVAVVRIGWHNDPSLNDLKDITEVLLSKVK
jgi:hypothetical protein